VPCTCSTFDGAHADGSVLPPQGAGKGGRMKAMAWRVLFRLSVCCLFACLFSVEKRSHGVMRAVTAHSAMHMQHLTGPMDTHAHTHTHIE
jgi:hypothetical protein